MAAAPSEALLDRLKLEANKSFALGKYASARELYAQAITLVPAPCPQVPQLPVEARQPPTPTFCSPDCSTQLGSYLSTWRQKLTAAASPAGPASAPTTP